MSVRNIRRTAGAVLLALVLAGCGTDFGDTNDAIGAANERNQEEALAGAGLTLGDEYDYDESTYYGYGFPTPDGAQWGVYGTVAATDVAAGTLTVDVTRSATLDEDGSGETADVVERSTYRVAEAIRRCDLYNPQDGYTVPLGELLQGATVTVFGTSERVLTVSVENLRYCDTPATS